MPTNPSLTHEHLSFLDRLRAIAVTVGEDAFFELLEKGAAEFAAHKAQSEPAPATDQQ